MCVCARVFAYAWQGNRIETSATKKTTNEGKWIRNRAIFFLRSFDAGSCFYHTRSLTLCCTPHSLIRPHFHSFARSRSASLSLARSLSRRHFIIQTMRKNENRTITNTYLSIFYYSDFGVFNLPHYLRLTFIVFYHVAGAACLGGWVVAWGTKGRQNHFCYSIGAWICSRLVKSWLFNLPILHPQPRSSQSKPCSLYRPAVQEKSRVSPGIGRLTKHIHGFYPKYLSYQTKIHLFLSSWLNSFFPSSVFAFNDGEASEAGGCTHVLSLCDEYP